MNYMKMYDEIKKILPRATVSIDNYGQVVIYTDMQFRNDFLLESYNEIVLEPYNHKNSRDLLTTTNRQPEPRAKLPAIEPTN